ncbi:MAG: DNA-binding protein WhiA [Peptococcaceae bacterium]|jgi:DNA-binding protein WhiA|nr:DNA-binding protein WhiA [Peptococcaceae bacterium]
MADKAPFSLRTKLELARLYPVKECCRLAELAAIARLDGAVTVASGGGVGFYIATESSAAARKVYRLWKDCFALEGELTVKRQNRLKRHMLYCIQMPPSPAIPAALQALGILSRSRAIVPGVKKSLIKTQCCRRSYLRGAFLASGSVSGPDSNYHLEISGVNEELAHDLAAIINRFPDLGAKISRRKQSFMIYLKDSDQIADFLALAGAHGSLLEFENTRVMKGMKNQVNRLVNCETANLCKTVDAALRQLDNIRLIDAAIGLDNLSPPLRQIARLRLENPEINLKELGEMLLPPIGKSGINHRLRKIEEIARPLRPRRP